MAQFEDHELALPGVHLLTPRTFMDDRGLFIKTVHIRAWSELGIEFNLREEFYSISKKDVIRGMHFQAPPAAHQKVVTCLRGTILDVLVDLRKDSPMFGKHLSLELTDSNRQILFIPVGVAHGFLSQTKDSLVIYKTDREYVKELDRGIHFQSFGFSWPVDDPIVSSRDAEHPRLDAEFESPF